MQSQAVVIVTVLVAKIAGEVGWIVDSLLRLEHVGPVG